MKRIIIPILLAVFVMCAGCSKEPGNKLIGVWKTDTIPGIAKKENPIVIYTFSKDSMINTAYVHGEAHDAYRFAYVIKQDAKTESDTMILEATHPASNHKGDFRIFLKGKKMLLTTPDNNSIELEKQPDK